MNGMVRCNTVPYKEGFCKNHYMLLLRQRLMTDIKRLYKDPESAFAIFNFQGKNSISMQDILGHKFIKICGYDVTDVKSYLLREKVFRNENDQLDFLKFKKYFFP